MRKQTILAVISTLLLTGILMLGYSAHADDSTQTLLNPFSVIGGYIKARSATNGLQIPSLASQPCLGTDSSGKFGAGTCSGGGGGSGSTTIAGLTPANGVFKLNGTTTSDANITLSISTTSPGTINFNPGFTGVLSVARGGTGNSAFTANDVLFGNGTSAIATSSNLTFNSGNFGIGTTAADSLLNVRGSYPSLKIYNTTGAQYAGAGFYMINQVASMGNQAGTAFYSGINDGGIGQGYFAIDQTNSSGGGTGHKMLFDYNAGTTELYDPVLVNGNNIKLSQDSGGYLNFQEVAGGGNGLQTIMQILAPTTAPQESTLTLNRTATTSPSNREFTDITDENYNATNSGLLNGGSDHAFSLNVSKQGTGTFRPFIVRFWNQDLGNIVSTAFTAFSMVPSTNNSSTLPTMASSTFFGTLTVTSTSTLATTSAPQLFVTNLVSGNCVQAAAGGQLTTTGSACGSGGGSLSGGTTGFVATWASSTALTSGALRDNGTVSGVNATSSTASFNVQGTTTLDPFRVASSGQATLLVVKSNGSVGIGTDTPSATLGVRGTSTLPTLPIFNVASSSNASYLSVSAAGVTTINSLTLTNALGTASGGTGINNPGSLSVDALLVFNGSSGAHTLGPSYTGQILGSSDGSSWGSISTLAGGNSNNSTLTVESTAGSGTTDAILFKVASQSEVARFTTGRSLLINTTTPIATFVVQASSSGSTLPIFTVASFTATSLLTVLSNGNVGIGSATPSSLLSITNTASTTAPAIVQIGGPGRLGCMALYDMGASGYVYMKFNNGTFTTSTSATICQ